MNDLLVGLLSALVATNTPLAVSNLVKEKTGITVPVQDPNDPVEMAYRQVLAEDDAALVEVERWRANLEKGGIKPGDVELALLNNRIRQRVAPVRKAYEEFLEKNPRHTNARVAYAAFLEEVGEEPAAGQQLAKAVELDPNSPAALNNLANHYGHFGSVTQSFALYERAVSLAPTEPLYHENLATTVFMFRKDAMAHYGIDEQKVFAKALAHYRKACELDPKNFDRAMELAKTYYGVKPAPADDEAGQRQARRKLAEEALAAWESAYKIAETDEEREGVRLHFARWQINLERFEEARKNLNSVTNATFGGSKQALIKKLAEREAATLTPAQ